MSRVGEVAIRLKLAASERDRAEEIRRHVEQVVIRRALDELERLVHDRFGAHAIVRVQRLSFRWRVDRDDLADPAIATAMAEDLAAGVFVDAERASGPARLRPDSSANVVVFADADHADAALLADSFEGRACWFHAGADARATWAAARAAGPQRVAAITSWLEKMDLARPVLRWLEAAGTPPQAETTRDGSRSQQEVHGTPAPATARGVDVSPPSATARGVSPSPAPHGATDARDASEPIADEPELLVVRSEAAGVWYFARLVLQLDMAEHLWCVGALEGAFLSHVVAAILGGGQHDPAWRWFGGAFDHEPPLTPLPAWGIEEVRDKLAVSLARVLEEPIDLESLAAELPPVVDGGDPPTRALVSHCAAALCAVFCARLGVPPDIATVRKHVMLPGRFVLGDVLRVELAMEMLDIDVRRAGLDFNPGHVPWLDRTVHIIFEGGSSEM